jgi:hypothetical protein
MSNATPWISLACCGICGEDCIESLQEANRLSIDVLFTLMVGKSLGPEKQA